MKSTHVIEGNEISGLKPKLFHNWVVICFFRQVKAKFAEDEGEQDGRRVTADCKVFFKCPIDAIGAVVSFEDDSRGVKVPLLDEMFKAM